MKKTLKKMDFKEQKKENFILITGSSGLVGDALITSLKNRNIKFVGCDIKNPARKDFIFEKCNLASEKEVFRLFQKYDFTQVVHLAAYIKSGNLNSAEREKMFQGNILATFNLVSAIKKNKIKRVIFLSSMTVYGLPQYLPVDENHQLSPLDFYAFSKVVSEEIIKKSNTDYLILRFPGIFALNRKAGAIYNFISKAIRGEDIHISEKSSMPWDVIFIEDVIGSLIYSIKSEKKNGIFNIGYGETIDLFSVAQRIVKLCKSGSKIIKDFSVNYPPFCLDVKKSKAFFDNKKSFLNFRITQFINFLKNER